MTLDVNPSASYLVRMRYNILIVTLLCSCGMLPHQLPLPRTPSTEDGALVLLQVDCPSFDSPFDVPSRFATGVALSDEYVLTAYHAISCPSLLTIHAQFPDGSIQRLLVEREDRDSDLARLEEASAGNFDQGIVPPMLGHLLDGDQLACASTSRGLSCGKAISSTVFAAPTRSGDSGAGVYGDGGRLVGIVLGGSDDGKTKIAPLDTSWLSGT